MKDVSFIIMLVVVMVVIAFAMIGVMALDVPVLTCGS